MDSENLTEEYSDDIENLEESKDSDSGKYKEGEVITFVKVRFPGNSKSFRFALGRHKFSYGQKVVAKSDRGIAVGYINSFPFDQAVTKEMFPIQSIKSLATDEDVQKDIDIYKKEKEVESSCKNLIEKHKLDMNLTHVEFTQFGKKTIFYFTAPARVDFRGLVKDLVDKLKTRIELRQISVRDRSAAVGGIGPCGRQLCCSSFLSKYGSVNIKMAKGQNLSLSSSTINGVCGQLKCCLKYEDQVYKHKEKGLPQVGTFVETKNGDKGRVTKQNILSEEFEMLTTEGDLKRYYKEEFKEKLEKLKMPKKFDNIRNELSQVIGLEEAQKAHEQALQNEMIKINDRAKKFADDTFFELFGAHSVKELID